MIRWQKAALFCLVVSLITLWSATTAAAVEITHFTYANHGESWREYLTLMAKRFEAKTGIKVNFIVSSGNYEEKLATMIAAGVPPDVTDGHPMLMASLIAQNTFEDLRPYVQRDKVPLTEIPPAAIAGVTLPSGELWGLPVSIYPVVTFFNRDLFVERGLQTPIQLGQNWTWNTMRDSARKLTVDKNGDRVPEIYGASNVASRYEMQVHQAGGQLYDSLIYPTKSLWNSQPVLQTVEFLQEFFAERWSTTSSSVAVYMNNAAFSVTDGPGFIGPYYQTVSFDWDIAVQPLGPVSRASRVNPDGFQIVAYSSQKEAAWQWIYFLVAEVENQLEMAKITGRLPSLRQAIVNYPKVTASLKMPTNWAAFLETAFQPDGYAAYVIPNANAINPIVNAILPRIWNGQVAPAIGLQQIHEQVSAVLNTKLD